MGSMSIIYMRMHILYAYICFTVTGFHLSSKSSLKVHQTGVTDIAYAVSCIYMLIGWTKEKCLPR